MAGRWRRWPVRGYDGGAGDFQMGPLTFMLNYPDHCGLPSAPVTDRDRYGAVWFTGGMRLRGDYDLEKLTWLWHHTTLEDSTSR